MTTQEPDARLRTHEWMDPVTSAATTATMDGLTALRAVVAGELPMPPIASTLGFELESFDRGEAVFRLKPAEYHYNPIGSVHGGVYATLLDSATGCAVHTMLPAGTGYTSLDLNVKFLRRITLDTGAVRCVGTVVHFGRRTALARAEIRDESGDLLAEATSTCLIIPVSRP